MPKIAIHNPHDSFFKHVLSNLTVAKDLIQAYFDPEITRRFQWDTLRLSNTSHVDEHLKHLHSDMVYTCQLDEDGPEAYVLVEHQSTPDEFLPFRVMQYNMAILTRHYSQNKHGSHAKLPLILCLCLYSGKRTPYPYSLDSKDCFLDPTRASVGLPNPVLIADLGQLSEAELKQHGTVALLELLLREGQEGTFLNWLKANPSLVIRMMDDLVEIYGTSSISFILGVEQEYSSKEIIEAIINIVPHKKENIMTAAQQLRQEGIQEGVQQGMQSEKLHIAKNMLSKGLAIHLIRELAGVSEEDLTQLQEDPNK